MGIDGGPLCISCMLGNVITVVWANIRYSQRLPFWYFRSWKYTWRKLSLYLNLLMIILGRDDKATIKKTFWNAIEKHGTKKQTCYALNNSAISFSLNNLSLRTRLSKYLNTNKIMATVKHTSCSVLYPLLDTHVSYRPVKILI